MTVVSNGYGEKNDGLQWRLLQEGQSSLFFFVLLFFSLSFICFLYPRYSFFFLFLSLFFFVLPLLLSLFIFPCFFFLSFFASILFFPLPLCFSFLFFFCSTILSSPSSQLGEGVFIKGKGREPPYFCPVALNG